MSFFVISSLRAGMPEFGDTYDAANPNFLLLKGIFFVFF